MVRFGHVLQVAGILIAPLGLFHFFTAREFVAEPSLMAWELGCLSLGAITFLVGRRICRRGG
ncbi:MAG: hypothetical protein HY717_21710 [Planctomycetes bacterium]|nr:hypothetical protein [Planctomycetota bacterium]